MISCWKTKGGRLPCLGVQTDLMLVYRGKGGPHMLIIRDFSTMFQQMSGMPLSSKAGKDILKKAGIEIREMTSKKISN